MPANERNAGFIVRRVAWDNALEVAGFAIRSIKEVYKRDVRPDWDRDLLDFQRFYLETPGNAFFAAYDGDGEIVGALAVRRYDGRNGLLDGLYDLKATAELCRCFVVRGYRRMGVASLLVKEAERFCRTSGYRVLYLHTHRHLPGALDFWLSQGFMVRADEGGSLQTVHLEKVIVIGDI